MTSLVRESSCEAYTRMLGAGIAAISLPGDTITLSGDLGAGKTTLTRAIVTGLGGDPRAVSSPTFVVINEYPLPAGGPSEGQSALRRVAHIDAYRLDESQELETLGWDRYFDQGRALGDVLAIIEWPQRLGARTPPDALRIDIEATGATSRRFEFVIPESWTGRKGLDRFIEREPARCRVTGAWISPTHPTYPFADARSRDADLHRWFSGQYRISREATSEDTESDS